MTHLLWLIPSYLIIGILIAHFCMRFAGAAASDATSIALFWPLFISFCVFCGIHNGVLKVLVKMEKKHENQKR